MRGKRHCSRRLLIWLRNIPAYAGKTYNYWRLERIKKEHPRVCGENEPPENQISVKQGTSPRMRGKPACFMMLKTSARNIPAYAGKTQKS